MNNHERPLPDASSPSGPEGDAQLLPAPFESGAGGEGCACDRRAFWTAAARGVVLAGLAAISATVLARQGDSTPRAGCPLAPGGCPGRSSCRGCRILPKENSSEFAIPSKPSRSTRPAAGEVQR